MNHAPADKSHPYSLLFEPVNIGPKTAPNRFYQVPHGSGMGYRHPQSLAAMRGVKAEGGWGVVCSEYTTVHPSMDDTPSPFATLWSDDDIRANALVADAIHAHGALSAVELCIGGNATGNLLSRTPAFGINSTPVWLYPWQTRRVTKRDIVNVRRWHREAAQRAVLAGHDIVYVYATHGYFLSHFLDKDANDRSDEYGGSLRNRIRIVQEIIEDTKEAVGDKCAVAVRFSVDQGLSSEGTHANDEARQMLSELASLPDLWDLNVQDWTREIGPSRFYQEGMLEQFVRYASSVVKQPIVSTGRFTSPDTMMRQIKSGLMDFIGAARPSIADPFLPSKIRDGRIDEIRECIGCNVCYTGTYLGHPIRCTQNPTMGMEWQRGWHPESVPLIAVDNETPRSVLVIGAGPAGLEAALTAAKRGFQVAVAEASTELGGRVSKESRLPGLNEWARVRDYRVQQLLKMPNVDIYRDSELTAEMVLQFGYQHVIVATGAIWRSDGIGRYSTAPIYNPREKGLVSVNAILDDQLPNIEPASAILIFDDDDYYMASVIALKMRRAGHSVTLVCSKGTAAHWSQYTEELSLVNAELINEGVELITNHHVTQFIDGRATLSCVFSGKETVNEYSIFIPVTSREPREQLYRQLIDMEQRWSSNGVLSVQSAGDCLAPGIIAQAVHAGHEVAMTLESDNVNHDVREIDFR